MVSASTKPSQWPKGPLHSSMWPGATLTPLPQKRATATRPFLGLPYVQSIAQQKHPNIWRQRGGGTVPAIRKWH
eukprot:7110976-Lingulodinium_polyedra.AAC.1